MQIYRDLDGDAMLVSIQIGTNMAVENRQKHLSRVLLQKCEFISQVTQNNTFSNTRPVQIVKFSEIVHFFNRMTALSAVMQIPRHAKA